MDGRDPKQPRVLGTTYDHHVFFRHWTVSNWDKSPSGIEIRTFMPGTQVSNTKEPVAKGLIEMIYRDFIYQI